jgi:hypothetical protein
VLAKRNRTEDKAELFARIWGKGVEQRVIDGQQTIKHSERVEALQHLGWGVTPALSTAYNITSRVLSEREPRWKTGDIVRSADNKVYIMEPSGRWRSQATLLMAEPWEPKRPITKIGVST